MGAVWSGVGGGAVPRPEQIPEEDNSQHELSPSSETEKRTSEGTEVTACEEVPDEYEEKRKMERKLEIERFKRDLADRKEARLQAMAALGKTMATLRTEKEEEAQKRESLLEEKSGLEKRLEEAARMLEEERSAKEAAIDKMKLLQDTESCLDVQKSLEKRLEEAGRLLEEERAAKEAALEHNRELEEKTAKTEELQKQVDALKDVANIGKQILGIREKQVNELNMKLKVIEMTGAEYEKEVENIRKLKALYEERARAAAAEHKVELERERARTSVAETRLMLCRQELEDAKERRAELDDKVRNMDTALDTANADISQLRIDLATNQEQLYQLTSQMTIVNTLFTQVLEGPVMDFDRLATLLEENHDLINDLTAKGKMEEVASVLLEIAGKESQSTGEESEAAQPPPHNEGVTENLSKVWRVLVELLSHHSAAGTSGAAAPEDVSCYKRVDTPKGPRTVISPSQTYIKLKDLILEKNSLVKEVGRLRTLNGHLETRLTQQQDRLTLVTEELHNTWAVVNQLRQQHKQLHNQEKILRFELKHKRLMLNELKKQLEICREQWELARQKNVQTEEDWRVLREEFASRKRTGCNSTESGYEDEGTASPVSEVEEEEESPRGETPAESVVPAEEAEKVFRVADILGEDDDSVKEEVLTMAELEELLKIDDGPNPAATVEEDERLVQEDTAGEISSDERLNDRMPSLEGIAESDLCTEDSSTGCLEGSTEGRKLSESDTPVGEIILTMEDIQELLKIDEVVPPPPKRKSASFVLGDIHRGKEVKTSGSGSEPEAGPSAPAAAVPQCSGESSNGEERLEGPKKRTAEEVLAGREARLKRLEEQCKSLFNKMNSTSVRGEQISNRLEELHEQYGEPGPSRESPAPQSRDSSQTSPRVASPEPPLAPPPPPPPMPPPLYTPPTIRPTRTRRQ